MRRTPFSRETAPIRYGPLSADVEEYEATFGIESKTDAHAIERLLNRPYDAVREESRTVRAGSGDSTETLAQFEAVRDAAQRHAPGRLTVVYERRGEPFEERGPALELNPRIRSLGPRARTPPVGRGPFPGGSVPGRPVERGL